MGVKGCRHKRRLAADPSDFNDRRVSGWSGIEKIRKLENYSFDINKKQVYNERKYRLC